MMRLRFTDLTNAEPFDRCGHRLPSTFEAIAARNALLVATANRHFAGMSARRRPRICMLRWRATRLGAGVDPALIQSTRRRSLPHSPLRLRSNCHARCSVVPGTNGDTTMPPPVTWPPAAISCVCEHPRSTRA